MKNSLKGRMVGIGTMVALIGATVPSATSQAAFTPYIPCDVFITQADISASLASGQSYLITSAGKYCLAEDITVSLSHNTPPLSAITIDAASIFIGQAVVLDLQQHRLQNTTAVNMLSFPRGVFIASSSAVNVSIVNGTIAGFKNGVAGYNIAPYVPTIDKIFFDNNVTAVNFRYAPAGTMISNNTIIGHEGIRVDDSNGVTVENNKISLNAGMWHAPPDPSWVRIGISLANGSDYNVIKNDVTLYESTADCQSGIYFFAAANFSVYQNTVRNARFGCLAIEIYDSDGSIDVQYNNIYSDKGFCIYGLLPSNPAYSTYSPAGLRIHAYGTHNVNAQYNIFVGAFTQEILIESTVNSGLVANNTFYFPSLNPITNKGTVEVGANWYEESCWE